MNASLPGEQRNDRPRSNNGNHMIRQRAVASTRSGSTSAETELSPTSHSPTPHVCTLHDSGVCVCGRLHHSRSLRKKCLHRRTCREASSQRVPPRSVRAHHTRTVRMHDSKLLVPRWQHSRTFSSKGTCCTPTPMLSSAPRKPPTQQNTF
jgi:hypothetical protein